MVSVWVIEWYAVDVSNMILVLVVASVGSAAVSTMVMIVGCVTMNVAAGKYSYLTSCF